MLLAVSFSSLEPTEYGIAINGNTQQIDPEIRSGGRHFLGLGWYFVRFPNTVIAQQFTSEQKTSIPARSSDGLKVMLDISFEYQYLKSDLVMLYMKFAENPHDPISKIAREAVRVATSRFTATSFFTARNNISLSMYEELRAALLEVHCHLNSFQLLNIQLPAKFDLAIQQTEITRQNIETARQQQARALIEADTQVEAAKQQALVIKTRAEAEANATRTQGMAEANSIVVRARNLVDGLLALSNNMTMSSNELLAYYWVQALQDTKAKTVYSVAKPPEIQF